MARLPFEPGGPPSGAIANNQLHWLLAAYEPSQARRGRVLALSVLALIAWPDASQREIEKATRIDRRYLRRAKIVRRWMPRPAKGKGWLRVDPEWLEAPVPAAARLLLFALRRAAVDADTGAWLPGQTSAAGLYRRAFPRGFWWYEGPNVDGRLFRRAVQQLRKAGYLDHREGLAGSGKGWRKAARFGGGRLPESGGRLPDRAINKGFLSNEAGAAHRCDKATKGVYWGGREHCCGRCACLTEGVGACRGAA